LAHIGHALRESLVKNALERAKMTPLIKVLTWSTCSVAIATAIVAVAALASPGKAEAQVLAVPEPAVLLLLGIGLSAIAFRFRASRRPQDSPDRSSR
jgi:hypothetical protein